MTERPKLTLHLAATDKILEGLGWLGLLGLWLLITMTYSALPGIIPIHYNAAGEPDASGSKIHFILLTAVATVLVAGLTALNRFPHKFNYLVPITKENAVHQYTQATRMIRVLKLAIVVVFGIIAFKTAQPGNENSGGLGVWFVPLTIAIFFIPVIYFLIKSTQRKKE